LREWSQNLSYSTEALSIQWPKLILGALLSAVLALSVHFIMLQVLHIPDPSALPHSRFSWLLGAPSVLGAVFLYALADDSLKRWSFVTRSLILFLLITMLQEIFLRLPIMESVVTNAWIFSFLSNVPRLLPPLLVSCLVVITVPLLKNIWSKILASLVLQAVIALVFRPLIQRAWKPVLDHFAYLAHDEVYSVPYEMHVLIPAYLTFAEAVCAALLIAALVWGNLSSRAPLRFLQFILIILLIRNHLVPLLIYPFFAKISIGAALLSEGQFTLETATLGLLTALTWQFSTELKTRSLS
jgi:hypothetical protein